MPPSGQLEKQKKTCFYLFLFVFIVFFFVRTYGAISYKDLKIIFLIFVLKKDVTL
jgi:hypothetical protein